MNFYCFKELKYVAQPQKSNWCWASCLSQMIKGLNSPTSIGKTQCELVGEYKNYKEDTLNYNPGSVFPLGICCDSDINHVPNGCNIALSENDLLDVHTFGGFKTNKIEVCDLFNFTFVIEKLKRNQSPIVLKINKSGVGHINLISGYGKKDGCEYILVSDPLNFIGEVYTEFSEFCKMDIDKAWSTEVMQNNLKKDSTLKASLNFVQNFIDLHVGKSESIELKNPWNYLAHKNPEFIAKNIDKASSGYTVNSQIQEFKQQLQNDFSSKLKFDNETIDFTCEIKINKDLTVFTDINYINEKDLFSLDNDKIKARMHDNNAISYIKDYATKVKIKIVKGERYYLPEVFPNNYTFKKKWYTKTDFIQNLNTQPTVTYFFETEKVEAKKINNELLTKTKKKWHTKT